MSRLPLPLPLRRRLSRALALSISLPLSALALAAPAGAFTEQVTAGRILPKTAAPGTSLDDFYRNVVTIHVGDSVRWTIDGFHTVTFPAHGQPLPPFAAPNLSDPITGVSDAAGLPFWFDGLPNIDINLAAAARTPGTSEDGTQMRNSGIPREGQVSTYTLTFTKPGTYHYVCLIHPGMEGWVKVVSQSVRIPTAAQNSARANLEAMGDMNEAMSNARKPAPKGNVVLVGREHDGNALLMFYPQVKRVTVGRTVTFEMTSGSTETHTVTFGPASFLQKLDDRYIQVRFQAPGLPPIITANPLGAYPSSPGPLVVNGASHGNGFVNSGELAGSPSLHLPRVVRIKFTKPGVYHYQCVIHKDMQGTIIVVAKHGSKRR